MYEQVCGHTYSKAGLEQMFRLNKHKCPVPGCTNNSVQVRVEVNVCHRSSRLAELPARSFCPFPYSGAKWNRMT